jgi:hypothetical protein
VRGGAAGGSVVVLRVLCGCISSPNASVFELFFDIFSKKNL